MFAYCLNNPVMGCDSSGQVKSNFDQKQYEGGIGGLGVGVIISSLTQLIQNAIRYTTKFLKSLSREVYQFAKSLYDYSTSRYADQQPRVHHIIPAGKFANRNLETQMQINYMHDLLNSVDIDINDPENLIVISQGSHKSLHTNDYISNIYIIMLTAVRGDEDSVRLALFFARIYASSLDQYPYWY